MLPCNYGLRQDIDTALSLAHTAQYIPTASRSPAVAIAAVGTVARDLMCNPKGRVGVKSEAAAK